MGNLVDGSEKSEFWRLVLQEQRASGLTIRAFCKREGISEPSFYAWRKKVEGSAAGMGNASRKLASSDGVLSKPLLPVTIEENQSQVGSVVSQQCEVITPSGLQLRFDTGLQPERLRSVLASMLAVESERLPC